MAVLVCIPTNSVRGFPFLHMFQHLALNLVSLLSRPPHTIPSVSDLTWATPTLTLTQMSLADSDSTLDSPSHNKLHCSHMTSPARSSVLPAPGQPWHPAPVWAAHHPSASPWSRTRGVFLGGGWSFNILSSCESV